MSEFSECLEEMRNHYKSSIASEKSTRYVPASRFSHFFSKNATQGADAQNVVGGLQDLSKSLTQEEASQTEAGITEGTQALKDNNVSPAAQQTFKEKMDAQRQKTKDKAIENIDKIFNEAEKVAADNPEYEDAILATMVLASDLADKVWNTVKDYIVSIVKTLIAWVKTAWEDIKTTFQGIAGTISGWFSMARLQPN